MKKLFTLVEMLFAVSALAQPPEPEPEPSPLDEIITLGRTQPISVEMAPKGCVVHYTAKYCRTDGRPIVSIRVLEEKILGLSSVKEPRIESGCVILDMSLGVPISKESEDQCEGGEPKVSVKLQVSAICADGK